MAFGSMFIFFVAWATCTVLPRYEARLRREQGIDLDDEIYGRKIDLENPFVYLWPYIAQILTSLVCVVYTKRWIKRARP